MAISRDEKSSMLVLSETGLFLRENEDEEACAVPALRVLGVGDRMESDERTNAALRGDRQAEPRP